MLKTLTILAVLTLAGFPLPAQDSGAPKALDLLGEALTKSIEKGAGHFQGKYERDSGMLDMAGGFMGGAAGKNLTGPFTMKIGKNGMTLVTLVSEDGRLELYGQGVKRAQRLSWGAGKAPSTASVHEMLTVLSFPRLKKALKDIPTAELKGEETVRDEACWIVVASLPKHLLASDADATNPVGQMIIDLKGIQATFFIAKSDRVIRKVKVTVTRGMSDMVKAFLPQGDDKEPPAGGQPKAPKAPAIPGLGDVDPEAVKGALDAMKAVDAYTLQVDRFDPALTVEVPAELRTFFNAE